MKIKLKIILPFAFLLCSLPFTFAQEVGELYDEIKQMDSLYFSAQNKCDLEKYASFLSEDFEFFHDKGGFTASKDNEMADMSIFCGEAQRSRQPLRRELISGSLKVYPMDNYGALESCDHAPELNCCAVAIALRE